MKSENLLASSEFQIENKLFKIIRLQIKCEFHNVFYYKSYFHFLDNYNAYTIYYTI